jgi:outer membrane receptor protein involved in Fe transport
MSIALSRIAVLSLMSVVFVPPVCAESALTDLGLEDALRPVLGGSRLPVPAETARLPMQPYVYLSSDLEASGAKTLAEALRGLPGVVLYDQVGNGYQPTLDLRGFNASPVPATVVLIDGVRQNEPDFGQVNWQLIPLDEIERVEVLPGPQTMYGPGAMGGVVSITTKRGGAKTSAIGSADEGSFGLQRYAMSLDGPAGPLTYRADASRETEDGYRRNSGARLNRGSGRLDYRDDKTAAWAGYRFADDDLKQAGSLTADELGFDRRQNISFVHNDSLLNQGTLGVKRSLTTETSLSFLGDIRRRLENTPLNQGRTSVSTARAAMDGLSGTLQADDRRAVFDRVSALSAGVEASRDASDSTSAGSFSGFGFTNSNFDVQRRLGAFAQESFDLLPKTVVLTAGARWDGSTLEHNDRVTASNSGVREYNHISPRVGLNWNPVPAVEAFASLSDSFRAPTADEITALGPFSSAPNLRPVKARSLELGARVHGGWGEGSASVYRTIAHDEIYAVYDPTAGFGQNTNIDKTRRDGVELTLKPKWGDMLDGFVQYGYTQATFQTAFTLDKAPFPATQQVKVGSYLPQVPRHRLSFGANAHPFKGATVGMDELCVSSQFLFGDESNTEARLGGYCVLGGGASYETGVVRVFARGDNLLDRRYETRGILGTDPVTSTLQRYLVPAAGLSFSAGVRVKVGG